MAANPGDFRQRGVALAILLWFIAAMAVLLAGISMQARVDIKLTQLHAARAQAEAAGDGAIQLALAELAALESREELEGRGGFSGTYTVGEHAVTVTMQPLSGLIDLNLAGAELLYLLFSSLDAIDENVAVELAASVVEWRTAPGEAERAAGGGAFSGGMTADLSGGTSGGVSDRESAGIRHARFEAIEDLLLVPGIDRRIFEAVRDAVYVSQRGQAGVDWMVAPVPVLRALGSMDEASARDLVASRESEALDDRLAPADVDLSFQETRQLLAYRVDAAVAVGDDNFLRRRWVERRRGGQDGLPWRFFRTDAVRGIAVAPSSEDDDDAGF